MCAIIHNYLAQWLSWLERRPVTAEVESSNLFWVALYLVKRYMLPVSCRGNPDYNGVLAQLGEHLPYKQGVTGSSPVGPIFSHLFLLSAAVAEQADAQDLKSCGANPPYGFDSRLRH